MSNDSDDEIGYCKPPKKHRFKKGQSGCPSGGHEQRTAKQKAKAQAQADKQKAIEKELADLLANLVSEKVPVQTRDGRKWMTRVEITLRNVMDRGAKPDASDRCIARALKLYERLKLLDRKPDKPRAGVLVVNQPMTEEAWARATEGELLPKNPLHGIPGCEHLLDEDGNRPRRATDTSD